MNFKEYKAKRLQDPEFKQEYDDLAPEYEIVRSLIEKSYRFEDDSTRVGYKDRYQSSAY